MARADPQQVARALSEWDDPGQLVQLAPAVPPALLDAALVLAAELEEPVRTRLRAALARRFARQTARQVDRWARDAMALRDNREAALALADLAAASSGAEALRLTREAVQRALELGRNGWRGITLSELAASAPADGIAAVANAALGIRTVADRALVLAALGARTSEIDQRTALRLVAAAQRLPASHRASAVASLSDVLAGHARTRAREDVLEIALDGPSLDAHALELLVRRLGEAEREDLLGRIGSTRPDSRRVAALAAIMEGLQPDLQERALEIVGQISDPGSRAAALESVIANLADELIPQCWELAARIHAVSGRRRALAAVATRLDHVDLRRGWLAARWSGHGEDWIDAVVALAPTLPRSLVEDAIDTSLSAPERSDRLRALVALGVRFRRSRAVDAALAEWHELPRQERIDWVAELAGISPVERLGGLADESEQTDYFDARHVGALEAISSRLPARDLRRRLANRDERIGELWIGAIVASRRPLAPSVATQVARRARRIAQADARASALTHAWAFVPSSQRQELLELALASAVAGGEEVLGDTVASLAAAASDAEAAWLWDATHRQFSDPYAAGQAAGALAARLQGDRRRLAERVAREGDERAIEGGGELGDDAVAQDLLSLPSRQRHLLVERTLMRYSGADLEPRPRTAPAAGVYPTPSRVPAEHYIPSARPATTTLIGWLGAAVRGVLGLRGQASRRQVAQPQIRRADRSVSVGVSRFEDPLEPLAASIPLRPGQRYCVWFALSDVQGSIERGATRLPLPSDSPEPRLSVILFGAGPAVPLVGAVRANRDGTAQVLAQPDGAPVSGDDHDRLLFPFTAPAKSGTTRMRLSVYYEATLLQSRTLEFRVSRSRLEGEMLASKVDYTISSRLLAGEIASTAPHGLSILLNDSGPGTHEFYVVPGGGGEPYARSAQFDAEHVKQLVADLREALRLSSWGTAEEWNGEVYRYQDDPDVGFLTADLVRLAIRGWATYFTLQSRLGGDTRLRDVLRRPAAIQISSTESARLMLPAALVYDKRLDTGLPQLADYRLCQEFMRALGHADPLTECRCFEGDCPEDDDDVVCPSGFWGFRHELGMPVSVAGGPPPPPSIEYAGTVHVAIARSSDPELRWEEHQEKLQRLTPPSAFEYAAEREDVFRLLRAQGTQLVYFYCHGGALRRQPYLEVGPRHSGPIFADTLLAKRIRWEFSRPLVFLNGCRTTAVSPEVIHELVSAFVVEAWAGGVIGTEITVFEPLAQSFAEGFLYRFVHGATIGAAIRETRLELLKRKNPLGLAYVPFALSGLHMARSSQATTVVIGDEAAHA